MASSTMVNGNPVDTAIACKAVNALAPPIKSKVAATMLFPLAAPEDKALGLKARMELKADPGALGRAEIFLSQGKVVKVVVCCLTRTVWPAAAGVPPLGEALEERSESLGWVPKVAALSVAVGELTTLPTAAVATPPPVWWLLKFLPDLLSPLSDVETPPHGRRFSFGENLSP